MASHGLEQQYRLRMDESQPFVTGQPPTIGFTNHCMPSPVIGQVALQRQANGFNFDYEPDGSRGVSIQRVISYIDHSISMRRRGKNDSCDSLGRILCWVVSNAVLTCAIVIGLLFLLKYVNSPLLRSEGQNDLTESLLIENSAQKECRPCPPTEQNDDSSSKLRNCCTVGLNQEGLQKLIEKMTRETISKQLPATPNQRNIGGGQESSKAVCGALFFLDKDPAMTTQSDNYTALRGWSDDDSNVAYMRSCINYEPSTGEVIVSQGGFYLVYSHLAFFWEAPKNSTRPTVLGQEICVKITGVETTDTIAKDTRAIQPNSPGVGPGTPSYNSRTMTIVRLREGDRLTVNAKPSRLVIRNNAISSFGLYKV